MTQSLHDGTPAVVRRDADAVLEALDPEQREVAAALTGPVCVLAGAGATEGDSGNSNSAAGVCNTGGPAVNCTQEHDVTVSQTAVADGVGAVAVNDADVHTANQIAGRDAGVDSSAASKFSTSAGTSTSTRASTGKPSRSGSTVAT